MSKVDYSRASQFEIGTDDDDDGQFNIPAFSSIKDASGRTSFVALQATEDDNSDPNETPNTQNTSDRNHTIEIAEEGFQSSKKLSSSVGNNINNIPINSKQRRGKQEHHEETVQKVASTLKIPQNNIVSETSQPSEKSLTKSTSKIIDITSPVSTTKIEHNEDKFNNFRIEMQAKEEWMWFNNWRWTKSIIASSFISGVSVSTCLCLDRLTRYISPNYFLKEDDIKSIIYNQLIFAFIIASIFSLCLHVFASTNPRGSSSSRVVATAGLCLQAFAQIATVSSLYAQSLRSFTNIQVFFNGGGIGMVLAAMFPYLSLWFLDRSAITISVIGCSVVVFTFIISFFHSIFAILLNVKSSFVLNLLFLITSSIPVTFLLREPPLFFVNNLKTVILESVSLSKLKKKRTQVTSFDAEDDDSNDELNTDTLEFSFENDIVESYTSHKTIKFDSIHNFTTTAIYYIQSFFKPSQLKMRKMKILSRVHRLRTKFRAMRRSRRGYGELVNEQDVYRRDVLDMELDDDFNSTHNSFKPKSNSKSKPKPRSSRNIDAYDNQVDFDVTDDNDDSDDANDEGDDDFQYTKNQTVHIIPNSDSTHSHSSNNTAADDECISSSLNNIVVKSDFSKNVLDIDNVEDSTIDEAPKLKPCCAKKQIQDQTQDQDLNQTKIVTQLKSQIRNYEDDNLFNRVDDLGEDTFSLATLAEASRSYNPLSIVDFFSLPIVWGNYVFLLFYVLPALTMLFTHRDMLAKILILKPDAVYDTSLVYITALLIGFCIAPLLINRLPPVKTAQYTLLVRTFLVFLCIFMRGNAFRFTFFFVWVINGTTLTHMVAFITYFFHSENIRIGYFGAFFIMFFFTIIRSPVLNILRGSGDNPAKTQNVYDGVFLFMTFTSLLCYFWVKYFARALSKVERFEDLSDVDIEIQTRHLKKIKNEQTKRRREKRKQRGADRDRERERQNKDAFISSTSKNMNSHSHVAVSNVAVSDVVGNAEKSNHVDDGNSINLNDFDDDLDLDIDSIITNSV